MPAEFFALLLDPFGRYRHGCDPPAPHTPTSSLPLASGFDFSHRVGLSDFSTFFFISQRLSAIEPFLPSLRLTGATHQNRLVFQNRSFVAERNT
jgi:hypothetical protein